MRIYCIHQFLSIKVMTRCKNDDLEQFDNFAEEFVESWTERDSESADLAVELEGDLLVTRAVEVEVGVKERLVNVKDKCYFPSDSWLLDGREEGVSQNRFSNGRNIFGNSFDEIELLLGRIGVVSVIWW